MRIMITPSKSTKPGTIFTLVNRFDNSEKNFEWTGSSWASVGNPYSTKPSGMSVLGWSTKEYDE